MTSDPTSEAAIMLAAHNELYDSNFNVLMPKTPDKDTYSRLLFFLDWMTEQGRAWYSPALPDYQHYLLHQRTKTDPRTGQSRPAPVAPATVNAHLATIRGRYQYLLNDNTVRAMLYYTLPADAVSPADRKAMVDELLTRLENDIHPRMTPKLNIYKQDEADSERRRLTPAQVQDLIAKPGLNTPITCRDTAILALFACTGIRDAELVALDVSDLRQSLGGVPALLVRRGKGRKQRLIPYGSLDWCLIYVENWLKVADIHEGAVFRGMYKGGKRVRSTRFTEGAVNDMMHRYPILIDGVLSVIQPHDLRHTYARNAYLHGMKIEHVQYNLGHEHITLTQFYIGALDGVDRRPPAMFQMPHPDVTF